MLIVDGEVKVVFCGIGLGMISLGRDRYIDSSSHTL